MVSPIERRALTADSPGVLHIETMTEQLEVRIRQLEVIVNNLIAETKFNNRLAVITICVMAAGKEILAVIK